MSFDPLYHFSPLTNGGGGPLITRENYENFFLLYVDKELNEAERSAVERFVQENPDLQKELNMLQQSVMTSDEELIFTGKSALLKDLPQELEVNETNYEEYFVLYADNELSREQQEQVEQFVYRHPQYQSAFELIQRAVLTPDTSIVFPDKAFLYRGEEERKVVRMKGWRSVAAAVVLLIAGGITWFMISRDTSGTTHPGDIVNVTPDNNTQQDKQDSNNKKPNTTVIVPNESSIAQSSTPEVKATDKAMKQPATSDPTSPKKDAIANLNDLRIKNEKREQQPAVVTQEEEKGPALAQATIPEKNIDNKSNPANTSSVIPSVVTLHQPTVEQEKAVVANVSPSKLNTETKAVNTAAVTVQDNNGSFAMADDEEGTIMTSNNKKNKMRGFFRKVSRVVERTLNGENGANGKGTVRIASFEFARN